MKIMDGGWAASSIPSAITGRSAIHLRPDSFGNYPLDLTQTDVWDIVPPMATNLQLDDGLIRKAVKAGKHRSKKEAVTAALHEYVQRHDQARIRDFFGKIEFHPDWDYKADRKRR